MTCALVIMALLLVAVGTASANTGNKALFVTYESTNLDENTLYNGLIEEGFEVTRSASIPADMSEYSLVIVQSYDASWQTTADYMKEYVRNGGGAFIVSGVPAMFPHSSQMTGISWGYFGISYISEWFGTANYQNVGVSDAYMSIDCPFGTELKAGDYLAHCGGWGGAAVSNLNPETTQLIAKWNYGYDRVFAFTNTYENGRVFYIATYGATQSSNDLALAGALWAANEAPVAEIGGPYGAVEGSEITFDASASSDPEGDYLQYVWDFESDGVWDTPLSADSTIVHKWDDDYEGVITVGVSDGRSTSTATANVIVSNADPVLDMIVSPVEPCLLDTEISVSSKFTDVGILDTHTAVWDWGDGMTSAGIVTESNGAGDVSGEHSYTNSGIYWITLTVTDDDGGSAIMTSEYYIVIYDPEGGFVTGGGWIDSHEAAYVPDTNLSGKATFGFVSKYKKGATVPTGNTEFQFKVADLNFKSTSYDWLVIAGEKAKYKGTGTINGEGEYGFMLSAIDGDMKEDGIDMFRIKIWDKATDEIVYDNQIGDSEDADPSTAIGGGSIVVHKAK